MLLRVMIGKLTYSTVDEHYSKSILLLLFWLPNSTCSSPKPVAQLCLICIQAHISLSNLYSPWSQCFTFLFISLSCIFPASHIKLFVELSRAYIMEELLFSCKFVPLLIFYILVFPAFFSDFIKEVPYWSSYLFLVCFFVVVFSFIFISWMLITLQSCSGFCHTLT